MIPTVIHQIWSDIREPLPDLFRKLGETWKHHHPGWNYEFWDNRRMNDFVHEIYPCYWEAYNQFPYDVQRWDAVRYLFLYQMGGMYVDFDYEALEPIDRLIENRTCCFALEPEYQYEHFNKSIMFSNALMMSVPKHPFMKKIIEAVFSDESLQYAKVPKNDCVLNTTGPWRLIDLYEKLPDNEKADIYLIPAKYVTPFDGHQAKLVREGVVNFKLEECLKEAYAVHYFFGDWRNDNL